MTRFKFLLRILAGLGLALATSFGAAIVTVVVLAIIGLYTSGHNINMPDVSINYGFIQMDGPDIILMCATGGVFATTFIIYWISTKPKGK